MSKSIYLDWNVFQDIIQWRRNEGISENLAGAKRAGYIVPYSCAHMRDLSKYKSPDYINKDIINISNITNNWCVLRKSDDTIYYKKVATKRGSGGCCWRRRRVHR
jgi:hypothetical protein